MLISSQFAQNWLKTLGKHLEYPEKRELQSRICLFCLPKNISSSGVDLVSICLSRPNLMLVTGLSRHPVQGVTRQCAGKATVGLRSVRPERRRPHHQEGDVGRRDFHLRDARPVHGTHGRGELGQGTRREDLPCKSDRRSYLTMLHIW